MENYKQADNIFLIPNFFSAAQCNELIKISEDKGFEEALVETENGYQRVEGTRNNDRILFTDEKLAVQLFEKAQPYIPQQIGISKAVGLNELFRFYRYKPQQRFKKHHDQSFIRNEEEASYYTFMIYLNDNYSGGETIFNNCTIKPVQGALLIFLHQLEHEGAEILSGTKYILRTDIMYKLSS